MGLFSRDSSEAQLISPRSEEMSDSQQNPPDPRTHPPQIPLIDPTANVLALVAAETRRQDDLRNADSRRTDEVRKIEVRCGVETAELREKLAAAESRRIDALTLAESRRVDAVLSEQKNNVALASTRAELTATALAERVDTSAKALATSVTASAEALRLQVQATTDLITTQIGTLRIDTDKRITSLEHNQYQGIGVGIQRAEGRQVNQWIIGLAVVIGLAMFGFLSGAVQLAVHFMK